MKPTNPDIMDDIIGGANGPKDVVKEATEFLGTWSAWFVELINAVRKFFEEMKEFFK